MFVVLVGWLVAAAADAPELARAYERRSLEWSDGRIRRDGDAISTRKFARLTGDLHTVWEIDRIRSRTIPGLVVSGAGVSVASVGFGMVVVSSIMAVAEALACSLADTRCDFSKVNAMRARGETVAWVGAAGVVVGAAGFVGATIAIRPQLKLDRWYDDRAIEARVDVYNARLADELSI